MQMMRMVSNLRNELAGISSGMARRDSFIMGSGVYCVYHSPQCFIVGSGVYTM